MAIRRVKIRFLEPIEIELFNTIEGVTLVSSRNGREITLQVEGDLDRLIKTLAAYPVKDLQTETRSLEDIFLKYYETDQGKVG